MKAQAAGVGHAAPPVAKKNQSGSANGVKVGVRNGSAVTMCNVFISVWSASATMMLFSTKPVYGVQPVEPGHFPLKVADERISLVSKRLSSRTVDVHGRRII